MDSNENEIYREGQWVKNCSFEQFKGRDSDSRLEEINGTMSTLDEYTSQGNDNFEQVKRTE